MLQPAKTKGLQVQQYRRKPMAVEAMQYHPENTDQLLSWVRDNGGTVDIQPDATLSIHTLEGQLSAQPGDWIIKGIVGEFYPCRDDIFSLSYEAV